MLNNNQNFGLKHTLKQQQKSVQQELRIETISFSSLVQS